MARVGDDAKARGDEVKLREKKRDGDREMMMGTKRHRGKESKDMEKNS